LEKRLLFYFYSKTLLNNPLKQNSSLWTHMMHAIPLVVFFALRALLSFADVAACLCCGAGTQVSGSGSRKIWSIDN